MKSILLISDDPRRLAEWQDWLDDGRLAIHAVASLKSTTLSGIDCIITDRNLVAELPESGLNGIGLVVIGAGGFGDVELPHDSPSELRLACRLLAEIAKLRRQKKRQARLAKVYERMAMVDPLTQLGNRRGWEKFTESHTTLPDGVLAFFDLDSFKQINEEFGYERGDQIIQTAGEALKESLPNDAFLARWGGDEFVAAFSANEPAEALANIRKQWLENMNQRGVDTTATIGWSRFPSDDESTIQDQFRRAECALREAKRTGVPVLGGVSCW